MNTGHDTRSRTAGRRIFVAGANGYIGRHVVAELVSRGDEVVAFTLPGAARALAQSGVIWRQGQVTDPVSLANDGLCGERFDAIVSCLASRTGGIRDAWRVDHAANICLLAAAACAGIRQFVLLSAICVQNPQLAFQRAKLAFEAELQRADLLWSIVRPTAYFKSLAGQVPRVRQGKPFLLFGPGDGPACRPIGEADVARYVADCLDRPSMQRRILPVGGPGPAITPRERGAMLSELCGRRPRFRRIPLALFNTIIPALDAGAVVLPSLKDKAEFARIGRFYATQPMLVQDQLTGRYDAGMTPTYGSQTLRSFYYRVLTEGLAGQELGDQALF